MGQTPPGGGGTLAPRRARQRVVVAGAIFVPLFSPAPALPPVLQRDEPAGWEAFLQLPPPAPAAAAAALKAGPEK